MDMALDIKVKQVIMYDGSGRLKVTVQLLLLWWLCSNVRPDNISSVVTQHYCCAVWAACRFCVKHHCILCAAVISYVDGIVRDSDLLFYMYKNVPF
jgi:hypothetical protein